MCKLEIAALKMENADLERRIEDLYTNLAKRDEDRQDRTETSDWSATTKKELQQQVLHLCRYGLLARWVLQNNGCRKLVIVRCSGVEGHHRDTPSSWVNENSSPFTRNHQLYNKGKLFVEIHSNFIIHGLVIIVLTK